MIRATILAALLGAAVIAAVSAVAWTRAPKLKPCPTVAELIEAERFNRGPEFWGSYFFTGPQAHWLSRALGMAHPGVGRVLVIGYSDGSAGIFSYVGPPECWRLQILERRK